MESASLEISPEELYRRLQAGDNLQLVDVRETDEFDYCHLPGSLLLPLDELPRRAAAEVRAEGPVVVICHHGVRSAHCWRSSGAPAGRSRSARRADSGTASGGREAGIGSEAKSSMRAGGKASVCLQRKPLPARRVCPIAARPQYTGKLGSTRMAQASTPPRRFSTLVRPRWRR